MKNMVPVIMSLSLFTVATSLPARSQPAPPPGKMPTPAEFVTYLDTNKDGFVDKSEAVAEPLFAADFDKADVNLDKKVSLQEMTKLFESVKTPSE